MNKIKSLLVALALIALSTNSLFAQGAKDKFFMALGNTLFLDFFRLPTQNVLTGIYVNQNNGDLVGQYTAEKAGGLSYYTFGAKFRYNLVDLNDDKSISIHTQPALGLSFATGNWDNTLIGCFSIPLMVGFNTGNVSTYKTSQNKGFGIALGIEYFNGGLIKVDDVTSSEFYYTDAQGNSQTITVDNEVKVGKLLVPVVELAYRYWSKSNKARELSLQMGFGGKGDLETDSSFDDIEQTGSAKGPFHIRLMWSQYLNY